MGGGASNKVNVATFMRDKRMERENEQNPGPFVTISRQYGCSGYFLGQLLVDLLNTEPKMKHPWRVYSREILDHLSEETDIAVEMLNRLRRERPRMMVDFFRNISGKRVPGGHEIRNRIANIIREIAYEGHCIVIGMGGSDATADMANGLRVRLEAPIEWRVAHVVENEGLTPTQARMALRDREKEREKLRKAYATKFHRQPACDLLFDCSTFSLAQIAQMIVQGLKLKKMI